MLVAIWTKCVIVNGEKHLQVIERLPNPMRPPMEGMHAPRPMSHPHRAPAPSVSQDILPRYKGESPGIQIARIVLVLCSGVFLSGLFICWVCALGFTLVASFHTCTNHV